MNRSEPRTLSSCDLVFDGGMSDTPKVSIMIPTFRRPQLLKEAVRSALDQNTIVPYEVVVIDNSSDRIESAEVDAVILEFGHENLRLFRNSNNVGMFGNWNRCLHFARGEKFTILSDDDLLMPEYIDAVLEKLDGNEFVATNVFHFGDFVPKVSKRSTMKNVLGCVRDLFWYKNGMRKIKLADVVIGNPVSGVLGVLFDKNEALRIGGFDEQDWPSSDYSFVARYWMLNGGKLIKPRLAGYRWQCNESFSLEAVVNFIEKNERIRESVISNSSFSKLGFRLIKKTLRLQKIVQTNLYINKFSQEGRRPEIFSRTGMRDRRILFPQLVSWIIYYFMCMLSFLFEKHSKFAFSKGMGDGAF